VSRIILCLFSLICSASLVAQPYTFFENRKITPSSERVYPDSKSRHVMPLAGVWKAKLPNGIETDVYVPSSFDFFGKVVFERMVVLPKDMETRRLELVSEGINNRCDILVNDQFVASHVASSVPFKLDLPSEMLRFGAENKLTIVVDSRLSAETTFPLKPHALDKKNYGGIFRNLYLVSEPTLRLDDVGFKYAVFDSIKPPQPFTRGAARDTAKQIFMKLTVDLKIKAFNLRDLHPFADSLGQKKARALFRLFLDTLLVAEKSPLIEFEPESDKIFASETALLVPDVKLWQPNSPTRYRVELQLQTAKGDTLDDLSFYTGFRSLDVRNGQLTLNRTPLFLKGVHVVEEINGASNALAREDILKDMELIRSLGANAIRFSDAPNPLWYRLCDSLGILIFVELPVAQVPPRLLSKSPFLQNAEAALREVVSSSKFNPSVVAYGMGSGIDVADARSEVYLQTLYQQAKSATQNFLYFLPHRLQPSSLLDYTDFIAVAAGGGDVKEFEQQISMARAAANGKPVLIGEYGVLPQPDNHNGYSDPRSLEHQAKFFLDRYKFIEQENNAKRFISGAFVLTMADYHLEFSPLRQASESDKTLFTAGLLTVQRDKKMSYQMVKSLYAGERVYNPPIGSPDVDFSPALILISIFLTAFLVYLLNSNKRIRDNLTRAVTRPMNLFMDIRDQRLYTPLDPLLLLVLLSLLWASILSAMLHSLHQSAAFDFWLSHVVRYNDLRDGLNYLIINPHIAVPVFGVAFFILSLLLSFFIKVLFFLARRQITFLQILNVWSWSSSHWIVLIFIAAFIDRFDSQEFTLALFFICLLFLLVSLSRTLRGAAVVSDSSRFAVSLIGVLLLVMFLGTALYLFNAYNQTFAYIEFWQSK